MPPLRLLYQGICKRENLWRAWQQIYVNGKRSRSIQTQKEVEAFYEDVNKHIGSLQHKLSRREFKFSPAKGILKQTKGKKPRPIVISLIEDRIIQRAILDQLMKVKAIKSLLLTKTSFGGIPKKGVPDAIRETVVAVKAGYPFYLRSDIKSFFTRVPKPTVLEIFRKHISDQEFFSLFSNAIHTELKNLSELGSEAERFPIYEIGVAQGSCLSPLVANVLLQEFDEVMNNRDHKCFRYIDDFLIMAKSYTDLRKGFRLAQRLLSKHGLETYDPWTEKEKADADHIKNGLTFLGCDIHEGRIQPGKKTRANLIKNINEILAESTKSMGMPEKAYFTHQSLIKVLNKINNLVQGWGNQYSFCNAPHVLKNLDIEIDNEISNYYEEYQRICNALPEEDRNVNQRRLLGVHALMDSKKNPIYPFKLPKTSRVSEIKPELVVA
jgi:RNA-directed DNA polymerase